MNKLIFAGAIALLFATPVFASQQTQMDGTQGAQKLDADGHRINPNAMGMMHKKSMKKMHHSSKPMMHKSM